jgi:hypothetical protein
MDRADNGMPLDSAHFIGKPTAGSPRDESALATLVAPMVGLALRRPRGGLAVVAPGTRGQGQGCLDVMRAMRQRQRHRDGAETQHVESKQAGATVSDADDAAEKAIRMDLRNASWNAASCIFFLALGLDNSINHVMHGVLGDIGFYGVSAMNAGITLHLFGGAMIAIMKKR